MQKVNHRVQKAEALRELQAFTHEGVIEAEDLHYAARPTDALPHVRREGFG